MLNNSKLLWKDGKTGHSPTPDVLQEQRTEEENQTSDYKIFKNVKLAFLIEKGSEDPAMNGFCWDLHVSENFVKSVKVEIQIKKSEGKGIALRCWEGQGAEISEEVRGLPAEAKGFQGSRTVVRVGGPRSKCFLQKREKK